MHGFVTVRKVGGYDGIPDRSDIASRLKRGGDHSQRDIKSRVQEEKNIHSSIYINVQRVMQNLSFCFSFL